jgi:hypothetical protein
MGDISINALAAVFQTKLTKQQQIIADLRLKLRNETRRCKRLMTTLDQKQDVINHLTEKIPMPQKTYSYRSREDA